MSPAPTLRPTQLQDLSALGALQHGSGLSAFSEAYFTTLLERRNAGQACLLTAVSVQRPVAFSATTWVLDEATLLDVVVDEAWRGRGVALGLLEKTRDCLRFAGVRRWLLEVRESNCPALGLYQRLGFSRDGIRPGYYPRRGAQPAEAAVMMSLFLE